MLAPPAELVRFTVSKSLFRSLSHVTLIKMCHCEELFMCKRYLRTKRVESLYDTEYASDVVFLVGIEPDVWRIPGHRKILSKANPVFRALLEGPLASSDKTVYVEDVECRAFDYVLRYLYGKNVVFQSSSTALSTLYAAHKYLCTGLIKICVKYLDSNLNTKNVLEVYTHARLYTEYGNRNGREPSAPALSIEALDLLKPSLYSNRPNSTTMNAIAEYMDDSQILQASTLPVWTEALVHNCLQFIDENADEILIQEGIEDMTASDLHNIVKRDTLKIKREYVVFLALDRWANRECKRRRIYLSPANRRLVLGDLLYEIRFPFLSSEEFVTGPIQGGFLDPQELLMFSCLISKTTDVYSVPSQWVPHIKKARTERVYKKEDTFTLSKRTKLAELEKNSDFKKFQSIFKKLKNRSCKSAEEKNSGKESSSHDDHDKPCSKCFPEFFIDILVCLFD